MNVINCSVYGQPLLRDHLLKHQLGEHQVDFQLQFCWKKKACVMCRLELTINQLSCYSDTI